MPDLFQPTEVCIPDEGILVNFQTRTSFGTAEGGWVPTHSYVLVCPICVSPWASLRRADSTLVWPLPAACRNCPTHPADLRQWAQSPPGSILISWGFEGLYDSELLSVLPLVLLKREFQLHSRRLGEITSTPL